MKTVIETPTFISTSRQIWSEVEIEELITYLAINYDDGDVIPRSGGMRKLRWGGKNTGKRGGSRVIYYNSSEFCVTLVYAYRKNKQENTTTKELKHLKNEV
ncbi:MAG: type II toxin-antitoxin system RelE/ParE family toxin [Pasteurella sp.]|nr:type II toxin-antitoxin system RelE/ParE family toxin [Pasteurella sp.]